MVALDHRQRPPRLEDGHQPGQSPSRVRDVLEDEAHEDVVEARRRERQGEQVGTANATLPKPAHVPVREPSSDSRAMSTETNRRRGAARRQRHRLRTDATAGLEHEAPGG